MTAFGAFQWACDSLVRCDRTFIRYLECDPSECMHIGDTATRIYADEQCKECDQLKFAFLF